MDRQAELPPLGNGLGAYQGNRKCYVRLVMSSVKYSAELIDGLYQETLLQGSVGVWASDLASKCKSYLTDTASKTCRTSCCSLDLCKRSVCLFKLTIITFVKDLGTSSLECIDNISLSEEQSVI